MTRLEWTPGDAWGQIGGNGAARFRAGAGIRLWATIGLNVLALERPPGHARGHVGRSRTVRLGTGTGIRLRPVTGLHILALRILTLEILTLKILALIRPSGGSGSRVGRRGTARLGARSCTWLRALVALVIGPTRSTRRRVRAIGIGRTAVKSWALLPRRRPWPVVVRPGLAAGTYIAVRCGPIRLTVLTVGLALLTIRPSVRRTLLLTVWSLLLPLLLAIRARIRPLLGRRTRGRRFRSALRRPLPLRRFCLTRGLGLGTLPRRRGRPIRTRFRPLASRRRAGTFLRRALRTWATARGLTAAARATLLRTALRQDDPARRRVGRLDGGQSRQHGAGQKEQSQEPHRGLVSDQAEPNTERCDWFPADTR
ncbi:hypothetical protein [Methylobacterium sp. J-088]|uniref:hypothetical protein n=1 Tax=Methylobacterium sp. J-088 TaxID=2836664 RepID=UPI0028C4A8E2|nr:hypothetical protein [Methylobacterium sp. J-088]